MGYACTSCGYRTRRWMGFCPQCKTSGALEQSTAMRPAVEAASLSEIAARPAPGRLTSGVPEFDRAVGGGLVPGAGILLGGEPGVGKSTLLLQVAASIAESHDVVLVAAEESPEQIAMRARRMSLGATGVRLTPSTDVAGVIGLMEAERPDLVIVDSIQTVTIDDADGAAGGVAQVRESAAALIAAAKRTGCCLMLVGHVTKDGYLAGPKILEHMVDVVCALEGDDPNGLRFLRSLKNRFGSVEQSGIFEMTESGLVGVPDPSRLFMPDRDPSTTGSVLFPAIQGRRAILVEVQALVAGASSPQPRRSVTGLEPARVSQLLAVLERHAGLALGQHEVYVSVAGGLRVAEPAVDLPLALAIASSALDVPLNGLSAWGEVGLTGEVRPVSQSERRRHEAARLDSTDVLSPDDRSIRTLVQALAAAGLARGRMMAVS
jgi:DNA repair protein RadA/Sms